MRRAWKLSELIQRELLFHRKILIPKPPALEIFARQQSAQGTSSTWTSVISHFADKWNFSKEETIAKKDMKNKVAKLRDEILMRIDDVDKIENVLDEHGVLLFRRYSDGSAAIELLSQLKPWPHLALEVFDWRRKKFNYYAPITTEEYSKGIAMAGKLKNLDLANELFAEATNKHVNRTSLYNALMAAYMCNGSPLKCQSIFCNMTRDDKCCPNIITYNILISVYGRIMLVDHMEATFREIEKSNLSPNVSTYNNLISGYITAWMWDKMEKTYMIMKASGLNPELSTHLLMLRGYANAGMLEKMEEMYELVKDHVNHEEGSLIRGMIYAYSRSSDSNKVSKVEEMLKLIPEHEYRPWLNVLLICLYANEDLFEKMEYSINLAFEQNTCVTTTAVMRCIISGYFRQNDVDKLADFVKRAEDAGWTRCRALYHSKMVMYASQMRLAEMERVIHEMARVNMNCSKKTFWILYKAYLRWGKRNKLEQVVGLMYKNGYGIPTDACIT